MVYIYESHLGGMYVNDEPIDYNDLYCAQCGDYDTELFASNDIDEIRKFLKTKLDIFDSGGYRLEHCKDIYDECCSMLGE